MAFVHVEKLERLVYAAPFGRIEPDQRLDERIGEA
jgi:hypothetical protein